MAKVGIVTSPLGDYPYRLFIEPAVFTEWVGDQASQIEYSNFKNQVSQTRGYEYTAALNDVWVAMLNKDDQSRTALKQALGDSNGSI
jgi:predicted lipoprotein